jgi:hypothetical protein
VAAMDRWSDEATATFLAAARGDLQRQIGSAGSVAALDVEGRGEFVMLVARIRVIGSEIEVRGSGENLVDAYGVLRQAVPEPILAAAFEGYVTR